MKILQVHNYYRSSVPSGENTVVDYERKLLRNHGHEVKLFSRNSDTLIQQGTIGAIRGGLTAAWNPASKHAISPYLEKFNPDVVHVHNTFPLISPSIFHVIGKRAPKVLTLHNYRLVCANAYPLRNNKVCTECIQSSTSLPAVFHGCYRGSRIATLPLAASISLHRNITWSTKVDAFIVFTEFQRELIASAGIPRNKIHIKPNGQDCDVIKQPFKHRVDEILFIGRISEEKGVRPMIQAWRKMGRSAPKLKLIGEGPIKEELVQASRGLNLEFMGKLDRQSTQAAISRAKLLIVPSVWFEGFPMVILEAFASGTPVAASDIGALKEIVINRKNGVRFPPGDPESIAGTVRELWKDNLLLKELSDGAFSTYESRYSEDMNAMRLAEIYSAAIHRSRNI